jgi:hypothetical protein
LFTLGFSTFKVSMVCLPVMARGCNGRRRSGTDIGCRGRPASGASVIFYALNMTIAGPAPDPDAAILAPTTGAGSIGVT